MQSQEGGIVAEEYRTEYVVDRVNTLGRAFLGLSVECARCHDHKYDPITQNEFYRLYGFFNNVNEIGQIPYSGVPSPSVLLVSGHARASSSIGWTRRIAPLEASVRSRWASATASIRRSDWKARECGAFSGWLTASARTSKARYRPVSSRIYRSTAGARHPSRRSGIPKTHELSKPDVKVTFANLVPGKKPATLEGDKDRVPKTVPGHSGNAQLLVGDSHIESGQQDRALRAERSVLTVALVPHRARGRQGPLVTRGADLFNGNRGYEIFIHKDGTLTAGLHHVFPDNSIEIATRNRSSPARGITWR